jgi:hypothetical protein
VGLGVFGETHDFLGLGSEILDSKTRNLISIANVSDYVLSNELVSQQLDRMSIDSCLAWRSSASESQQRDHFTERYLK